MRDRSWTRRQFALALAAAAQPGADRGRVLPPERIRYADPTTEFPVLRLTSPDHSSRLPAPHQRAASRKRSFLLFSNDRTGSPQLYQLLLNTGEARQLTEASDLDPASPALSPDDRNAYFFDGSSLRHLSISNLREHEAYRVRDGWRRGAGFSLAPDGKSVVLVETNGSLWQVLRVALSAKAPPAVLAEAREPLSAPLLRPGRDDVLYRQGERTLMFAAGGASGARALPVAPGGLGPAYWVKGGDAVVYLSVPGPGRLNELRECTPEGPADSQVARTSQFAVFAPNSDGSVFAGASLSKAAPYVLLLLRVTRREFTICEHRASDPAQVGPIFSPDSQRVYFGSDRDGRPAIYSVALDRFIEKTGS